MRNDSPVFYEYFKRSLIPFFETIDSQKIKHVIHLGDLFDRRKYVNFMTAKRCREDFIEELEKRKVETHLIAGNHDEYYKNTHVVNALDELISGKYKHIHTHSTPHLLTVDGCDIQLLPWITEANYEESIRAVKNSKAEILMGHLELGGFQMYKNNVSAHGMDYNLFKRYDRVYTGHYHHKSTMDNVSYLGAFAEYTWSDYNDPRGFHVFDTKTRDLTFHQNKQHIFKMIAYDDEKNKDIMKWISEQDFSQFTNCYVKVVCVNKINPYSFDVFVDKLYKAMPIDIAVIEDMSAFKDTTDDDEQVDETEDTPTILGKYIENLTLPVNNDKMITFMRDIYSEALSVEFIN